MEVLLGEATSGGVGAMVALIGMYPLVVSKIRLQAQRKRKEQATESQLEVSTSQHYEGALDCLAKVYKEEGLAGLYSSVFSALGRGFWTNFIFYFWFAWLKKLVFNNKKKAGMLYSMLHGICAGICVQLVMSPTDLVVTNLMADKTGKQSVLSIIERVYKSKGIFGFWAGIEPALILTLNPGITTVVRNLLTPPDSLRKSVSKNFWTGAISKAIASLLTYPYVVSKVQLQTKKGHEEHSTSIEVLKDIVEHEGISGVYKGCELQLFTAVLKEAILNMARVEIAQAIMPLFVPQHKLKVTAR